MRSKSMHIGEAEREIMKVLWQAGEPVNTPYINRAVAEKQWKRTTISTFLTRLVDKGAVVSEKRGNQYYYTPTLSEEEYRRRCTGNLITELYNGSVRDLAAALFQEASLSAEDIRELRALIDEREE